ncbi:MAG: formate/nitrite transporter family protein [Peptoniphilaceae bacterium]|nr:formate/nitrite transporter family protein [Peptoniphilaceae bacterium]MDD7383506.1 formate/nitrite transporter family protein [Peptoniphilaceae bacterium]MDY3738679.1 formate/nitrite transporter family protein [Peptoniphilaceae bacterium]
MYKEIIEKLTVSCLTKKNLFEKSIFKYLNSSMLAGFFIGMGILIMSLSNLIFKDISFPIVKFVNGFVFPLALSYVIFAGGELFTGNILIIGMGKLNKKIDFRLCFKILFLSYLGNLLGAFIISFLFSMTNVSNELKDTIVTMANGKISQDILTLIFKGILCNILVCLAVLMCNRNISDVAKLIMIFWCIFPFVALGFEHSIANMTCLILAKIFDSTITISNILHNLIPVTIGNIIGGLVIAFTYFNIGKE